MRELVLTTRPRRETRTVVRTDTLKTRPRPSPRPTRPHVILPDTATEGGFESDPYVDYGRYLTAAGGVLIVYKDIDDSGRHSLWCFFAWVIFTGPEVWYVLLHAPIATDWIRYVCCGVIAFINLLIVGKPVEIFRRVEIRPDCLILDDEQIFWQRHMESLPTFIPDDGGNMRLVGTYGTRFIEYLTVRRFDENDRTPQVMAAGFNDALQQLWLNRP